MPPFSYADLGDLIDNQTPYGQGTLPDDLNTAADAAREAAADAIAAGLTPKEVAAAATAAAADITGPTAAAALAATARSPRTDELRRRRS